MSPASEPARVTHQDWVNAKNRHDVHARKAALAAVDDHLEEAKRCAQSMLDSQVEMDLIASKLDEYPDSIDL